MLEQKFLSTLICGAECGTIFQALNKRKKKYTYIVKIHVATTLDFYVTISHVPM